MLISNNEKECYATEKVSDAIRGSNYLHDCEVLTKMALRERYKCEANTHRNMLQRANSRGAVIHSSFRCFKEFLKCVGPIPAKGATLDRINNNDREYAPGKVRWADKRTQNNNKRDTLLISCMVSGDTFTVSRLAKLQGVMPATIRQRLARGWSDAEIIAGKRGARFQKKCYPENPKVLVLKDNRNWPNDSYLSREMTSEEKKYKELQEECEQHRKRFGEELLPADLDTLNEIANSIGQSITRDQYKRHFLRYAWPKMRPHLNFFNASEFHQKLIEEIDPEYVAKVRKSKEYVEEVSCII